MCFVFSRSVVSYSVIPRTVAHQAPLSIGFSRQEYWSGLLFPSPGDLPNPGIESRSPALQADSLPSELPGKSIFITHLVTNICLLLASVEMEKFLIIKSHIYFF